MVIYSIAAIPNRAIPAAPAPAVIIAAPLPEEVVAEAEVAATAAAADDDPLFKVFVVYTDWLVLLTTMPVVTVSSE